MSYVLIKTKPSKNEIFGISEKIAPRKTIFVILGAGNGYFSALRFLIFVFDGAIFFNSPNLIFFDGFVLIRT